MDGLPWITKPWITRKKNYDYRCCKIPDRYVAALVDKYALKAVRARYRDELFEDWTSLEQKEETAMNQFPPTHPATVTLASANQERDLTAKAEQRQIIRNLREFAGMDEFSVTAMNEFSLDVVPMQTRGGVHAADIIPAEGDDSESGNAGNVQITSAWESKQTTLRHEGTRERRRLRVNDVIYEDSKLKNTEFADSFGFGVYLEYWKKGMKNSVILKYKTLREELTNNQHITITEEQYDDLEGECRDILERNLFIAHDIGAGNTNCGIAAGTPMGIEHAICLKLYTDFTEVQREFKRHCRRKYKDESIKDLLRRNQEIAHWCRGLRECIMFYGQSMEPKQMVYSGMNARLMFNSLYQHVECPLSTSMSEEVADQFTDDHCGLRLVLQRANPKTRYFDVAPFSCFGDEKELLFMGSTVKITNIYLGTHSFKAIVGALMLMEQLINGRFIDESVKARNFLFKFLQKVTEISVVDHVVESDGSGRLSVFLDEQQYDTDAVLCDAEDNEDDGNIRSFIDNEGIWKRLSVSIRERAERHESLENALNLGGEKKYFWMLFLNFLRELFSMKESGDLWMNWSEINKPTMSDINQILLRNGGVIKVSDVQWVREYEWVIDGDQYRTLRTLLGSEYVTSPMFEYAVMDDEDSYHVVSFRFQMHGQLMYAIYLEMMEIPERVKRVRIEMDMKCIKMKQGGQSEREDTVLFRQWLKPKDMRQRGEMCGFKCFERVCLEDDMSLNWMFGVKVIEVEWRSA